MVLIKFMLSRPTVPCA